jgi:DNA-binding transcriptional LysR family regulator
MSWDEMTPAGGPEIVFCVDDLGLLCPEVAGQVGGCLVCCLSVGWPSRALAFEPAGWSRAVTAVWRPTSSLATAMPLVRFVVAGLGIGLPVLALSRSGRAGKIAS